MPKTNATADIVCAIIPVLLFDNNLKIEIAILEKIENGIAISNILIT